MVYAALDPDHGSCLQADAAARWLMTPWLCANRAETMIKCLQALPALAQWGGERALVEFRQTAFSTSGP